jgi:alpha-glucoside transport system permease protein
VTITVGTLKVFDIVKATTNGNFDTSVLAFDMYNYSFVQYDVGKGSAFAVLLFILVTPIVIYQIRNLRKQRASR